MSIAYNDLISDLLRRTAFGGNADLKVSGRPPTMASSEFLTNKEQGDWAERIVFNAINENSREFRAVQYGRSDSLSSGDEGFEDFYAAYQEELNTIGKRPDLLIFRRADFDSESAGPGEIPVEKAIAAIEVRSSSFLANRYSTYMETRTKKALNDCISIRDSILKAPFKDLLQQKSPEILGLLETANNNTFRELDFRCSSWTSSTELKELSGLLKRLKEQIKILHRRDYLSITPKVEDLALVNRWIRNFNVRHFYLQVFFDKAYVIPFHQILEIVADPAKEGVVFSIEEDVKNQGKTTIKVNVQVGREILGRIDMPEHRSVMKELERGRLLFYVRFDGGRGYLDCDVFDSQIIKGV
ncbi:MAG: AccI family restriction endonuclease [candidate division Zixibacteria bacterium]|nr:AccI family restriction endonuclease [candidate division Zixibacteria bacterium]